MSDVQALVYSEHSNEQQEDGLNLISSIVISEGMKVLDIGCGTGYLASILAGKVGPTGLVIGVDPDKDRLALARNKYGSVTNLTFQEGSTESIPGDNYDIVFSNYVLHWVEDKKKAFQNIFHCLKQSGTFAVHFETKILPFLERYINLMEPSRVAEVDKKYFLLTTEEIEEIASSSGFTVQYKKEVDRIVKFKNFDSFVLNIFGGYGGLVDTQYMDSDKLQELKESFGGGEVEAGICSAVSYVFNKSD